VGQSEGSCRRTLHPQLVAKAIFKDYDLGDSAEQVSELLLTGAAVDLGAPPSDTQAGRRRFACR